MRLQTERTVLREFNANDLDDLHKILGDGEVMENVEPPYSKEKTEAFLNDFCIGRSPRAAFAVVLKDTGKLIGYVLFKPLDEPDIFEMGWIFNKRFWRKDYAYEICGKLIRYGFEEMKLHKICAETIDPVKSVPLMEKLGMTREGVQRKQTKDNDGAWCDLYWYAILDEDFHKMKRCKQL